MLTFDLMNENLDPSDSNYSGEELEVDKALRPLSFDDFALVGVEHDHVLRVSLTDPLGDAIASSYSSK